MAIRNRDASGRFTATPAEEPMVLAEGLLTVTNPGDSGGSRVVNGALVSGAATVTFAARYAAVEVRNLDAAVMYVRTDGVAPAAPWDDAYAAGPGERILVPNQLQLWYQGFGAADGTTGNPGTTVKLAGSATAKYEVVGVG